MLDVRFRPLPKWNRKPDLQNRRAQFRSSYQQTLDQLEYELRKLRATDIRIEAGFTINQIRNDGWPFAKERPSHAGVVLYCETPDGSLSFPAATYTTLEDNLHAIALTLECLRAVDRYGVTLAHQQYLGFASLPPAAHEMNLDEAAAFISSVTAVRVDLILRNPDSYRAAYRTAAGKLHPDSSGETTGFLKLGQARQLLDRHHNLAAGGMS
jgi:hypothetical protein